MRIGNDAAKSYIGNPCLVKYGSDLINKTGFDGTVSTIVDQNFFTVLFFQKCGNFKMCIFSKTTRVGVKYSKLLIINNSPLFHN